MKKAQKNQLRVLGWTSHSKSDRKYYRFKKQYRKNLILRLKDCPLKERESGV
jgi:hypothetical protein